MRDRKLKYGLLMLMVLVLNGVHALAQQQVIMPTTGSSTLQLGPGNCYEVLDPGGTGYYPRQCNSTLYVNAPEGYKICIDGELVLGSTAELELYNGSSTSSPYLYTHQAGHDDFSRKTMGNNLVIHFAVDAFAGSDGYSLLISAVPPSPYNVRATEVGIHSVTLNWDDVSAATQWYVRLGGRQVWDTVNTTTIHYEGLECYWIYGATVRNNLPRCSSSTCSSGGFCNFETDCYLRLSGYSYGNCGDSNGVATVKYQWWDLVPDADEWYVRWRIYREEPDTLPWNYDTVYQQSYEIYPAICCERYEFEILNDNVGVHDSCKCTDYVMFRVTCENNIPCTVQADSLKVLRVGAHDVRLTWVDHTEGANHWTIRAHNQRTGEDQFFESDERTATLYGLYSMTFYTLHVTNNIGGEYICDNYCRIKTHCGNLTYNHQVVDSTEESVTLRWQDSTRSQYWTVVYKPERGEWPADTIMTQTPTITLTGLRPGTVYHYITYNDNLEPIGQQSLNDCVRTFQTEGSVCDSYADFDSYICYETYCGTYENPMRENNLVDYGPGDSLSRHTVHTDPDELDPRTSNQLHTVAPDGRPSVRLGNWRSKAESESIVYRYKVDTTKYNVLILNYAAVLQNPDHDASHQPKFTVVISDSSRVPFDDPCLQLNFTASEELGWNVDTANHLLWKDWTSVALNLNDLHDSIILITMTTADCADRGHYGYAYFSFHCTRSDIDISGCGTDPDRTLTAPEGFSYYWYKEGYPEDTLSTDRILQTDEFGTYICHLSPLQTNNEENCGFDTKVTTGPRFPHAVADYHFCDTTDCQVSVCFEDKSYVTSDENHSTILDMPIETRYWTFDDGDTSTEANPKHKFPIGAHWAMLQVGISEDQCTDTTMLYFMVEELPLPSPAIEFTPNYATLENLEIELRDIGVNCKRSVWYAFGEELGEGTSIIYQYPAEEDHVEILLVAYNREGCPDSVSKWIGYQNASLWVPNVFTPGRETNNTFAVFENNIEKIEVQIYTRAGLWVCTFDGMTQSWDGTKDGIPLPQAAYVYKITYSDIYRPDVPLNKIGTVLLLRE